MGTNSDSGIWNLSWKIQESRIWPWGYLRGFGFAPSWMGPNWNYPSPFFCTLLVASLQVVVRDLGLQLIPRIQRSVHPEKMATSEGKLGQSSRSLLMFLRSRRKAVVVVLRLYQCFGTCQCLHLEDHLFPYVPVVLSAQLLKAAVWHLPEAVLFL